jgi:hypothetical protein
MLQRVFAGALHDAEYSAAHNAAFSLARIYGHVTDRATLEVIRRPSRDPDAPSEQALSSWVEALPGLPAPGLGPLGEPHFVRLSDAPAAPLGSEPRGPGPELSNDINDLARSEPSLHQGPGPLDWYQHTAGPEPQFENLNNIKGLGLGGIGAPTGGQSENGAPTGPVTETPLTRARSPLLGDEGTTPPGGSEKGAPRNSLQVPVPAREFPKIEDLF